MWLSRGRLLLCAAAAVPAPAAGRSSVRVVLGGGRVGTAVALSQVADAYQRALLQRAGVLQTTPCSTSRECVLVVDTDAELVAAVRRALQASARSNPPPTDEGLLHSSGCFRRCSHLPLTHTYHRGQVQGPGAFQRGEAPCGERDVLTAAIPWWGPPADRTALKKRSTLSAAGSGLSSGGRVGVFAAMGRKGPAATGGTSADIISSAVPASGVPMLQFCTPLELDALLVHGVAAPAHGRAAPDPFWAATVAALRADLTTDTTSASSISSHPSSGSLSVHSFHVCVPLESLQAYTAAAWYNTPQGDGSSGGGTFYKDAFHRLNAAPPTAATLAASLGRWTRATAGSRRCVVFTRGMSERGSTAASIVAAGAGAEVGAVAVAAGAVVPEVWAAESCALTLYLRSREAQQAHQAQGQRSGLIDRTPQAEAAAAASTTPDGYQRAEVRAVPAALLPPRSATVLAVEAYAPNNSASARNSSSSADAVESTSANLSDLFPRERFGLGPPRTFPAGAVPGGVVGVLGPLDLLNAAAALLPLAAGMLTLGSAKHALLPPGHASAHEAPVDGTTWGYAHIPPAAPAALGAAFAATATGALLAAMALPEVGGEGGDAAALRHAPVVAAVVHAAQHCTADLVFVLGRRYATFGTVGASLEGVFAPTNPHLLAAESTADGLRALTDVLAQAPTLTEEGAYALGTLRLLATCQRGTDLSAAAHARALTRTEPHASEALDATIADTRGGPNASASVASAVELPTSAAYWRAAEVDRFREGVEYTHVRALDRAIIEGSNEDFARAADAARDAMHASGTPLREA